MDHPVSRTITQGGTTSYPLPAHAEASGSSPDRTMRHSRTALALTTVLLLVVGAGSAEAQKVGTCTSPLGEAYLDIGNVRARLFNNGNLFWRGPPSVYEVPKGGGASAIFNAGVFVGGLVGGELRVAGARYGGYEFWSGPLDGDGNPPVDCSVYDRLYKVSRSDIDDYEATGTAASDLREWPTGRDCTFLSWVSAASAEMGPQSRYLLAMDWASGRVCGCKWDGACQCGPNCVLTRGFSGVGRLVE